MSEDDAIVPLNIAVLTISDRRTEEDDTSGALLVDSLTSAGHRLVEKRIVADDVYVVRATVSAWIADPQVQVILTSGGTGLTGRDRTPEAIGPLLDKTIDGFGELFRMLSWEDIEAATIQSRCLAGIANATYVFCLPGSNGAVKLGWDQIIAPQLDSRTFPCNLVKLFPRLRER